MTWETHHRRTDVVRAALDRAERRRDGTLGWSDLPDAANVFDTPEHLLRALQLRWHTRLSGAIELELDTGSHDLHTSVVHAWRTCAARMPGLRALLDAHGERPAMEAGQRKDWVLLASAGGLAAIDDPRAAECGRQVERHARAAGRMKRYAA